MAIRSVYFIKDNKVIKDDIEIKWAGGFAVSQKQKNITSLHDEISSKYNVSKDKILEVSTKSFDEVGKLLSSINLKFRIGDQDYFFESVYQSSKVFDSGLLGEIHHPEWIHLHSYQAKKASQEMKLPLSKFVFQGQDFPLEPKTMFFDWLYISCIHQLNISSLIEQYDYFTDIEFNPLKMYNNQANALCKYKYLVGTNQVESFLKNPIAFYKSAKV